MPLVAFDNLPETSRLWVFPASRPLDAPEEDRLLQRVDRFLDGWGAHGAPLTAARDWRYGRFLLVAVDEASVPPSGCSIDAMARVLKEAGEELDVDFLDHGPVLYRVEAVEGEGGGNVRRVSRAEFKKLAQDGEVDLNTTVFDQSVTRLSQLRSGEWEKPAGTGWHRRAFFSS